MVTIIVHQNGLAAHYLFLHISQHFDVSCLLANLIWLDSVHIHTGAKNYDPSFFFQKSKNLRRNQFKIVDFYSLKNCVFSFLKSICYGHDRMVVGFTKFYLCNQCLSPLALWVWTLFMARCTQYNIMWSSLSVTCGRWVFFFGYSSFFHQ
jgi:hypothetical protein